MSVVEDVDNYLDDEPEPTWDEAVAAFEAGTPVRVVRPLRKLTVVYHYTDGLFTATSPDLTGFHASGQSLYEARRLVQEDLKDFLDPDVEVVERYPEPDPQIATVASRSTFTLNELPDLIVVTSSGVGRAFFSPGRGTLPAARA